MAANGTELAGSGGGGHLYTHQFLRYVTKRAERERERWVVLFQLVRSWNNAELSNDS